MTACFHSCSGGNVHRLHAFRRLRGKTVGGWAHSSACDVDVQLVCSGMRHAKSARWRWWWLPWDWRWILRCRLREENGLVNADGGKKQILRRRGGGEGNLDLIAAHTSKVWTLWNGIVRRQAKSSVPGARDVSLASHPCENGISACCAPGHLARTSASRWPRLDNTLAVGSFLRSTAPPPGGNRPVNLRRVK